MDKDDIIKYLMFLNDELQKKDVKGEICMVGGAVMCLCYGSRISTMDIAAIFEPKMVIYECAKHVADKNNLPVDWLNDGVKGFLSENSEFRKYQEMPNLSIYVASPEYLFAMKCLSARLENANEIDDIKFLVNFLNITSIEKAIGIITQFYPIKRFMPKIQYALIEI
jgi:hypothetical protein